MNGIPSENGIVQEAVEVVKIPLTIDVAGTDFWYFLVVAIFLGCCYFLLHPVRTYARHLLTERLCKGEDEHYALKIIASKKMLLVLSVLLGVTAYAASFYVSGVIDTLERITTVLLIVLLARFPYIFIEKHFVSFCEVAWGERVANWGIIASFVKVIVTFLIALAILNVFRLSINDFTEANLPTWVTALAALVFLPNIRSWIGAWSITFTHPFGRGDYIEIMDKIGTVVRSSLASTKLVGPSGEEISIPHKGIDADSITNLTTRYKMRVLWEYDLLANTGSATLEAFASRAAAVINAHAECVLVSCRYDGGVKGSHKLVLVFNIALKPSRGEEIDRVKNVTHCDIVSAAEDVGANFTMLKPLSAAA